MSSTNIKSNLAFNVIYQLLILALPLVTAPYLARVIGAEGVGIYSYAFSIAQCFVYIAMLGLNNYGNRSIAGCMKNRELRSRTFWSILTMQIVCSLCSIALYGLYISLFAEDKFIALLQGLYVLSAIFDINWFFFGIEKFKHTVIRNVIVKISATVAIFLFVQSSADVPLYVAIMAGSFLVSQLCLWPFLRQYVDYYKPSLNEILIHFKPNALLFVPIIAISIYTIFSKIMLGYISGDAALGFFESAVKIEGVPLSIITAIGTVMLPRTTALLAEGNKKQSDFYRDRTFLCVMLFSSFAAFIIFSVSDPFVEIFYGKGFERASMVLKILCVNILFAGFGNVIRTQYIIPAAEDKVFTWSAIWGALANVIVNILSIPYLNEMGAAIGALAAEGTVLFYQLYKIKSHISLIKYFKLAFVTILLGAIMLLFTQLLPSFDDAWLELLTKTMMGIFIFGTISICAISALKRAKTKT